MYLLLFVREMILFYRPCYPSQSRPIFWLYEEIWGMGSSLTSLLSIYTWFWKLIAGKEAVFSFSDPLPFIALNHLHLPFLVFVNLLQRKYWTVIDFCAGKLQN